jgi:hypothetical protein
MSIYLGNTAIGNGNYLGNLNIRDSNIFMSQSSSPYTKNIVTDGLILYLDASVAASNPGSGTTWYDLTPNDYDFTLVGGASFSGSGATACVTFDGSSGRATNSNATLGSLGSTTAATYMMTIKPSSTNEEDMFSTSGIGDTGTYLFMLFNGNAVRNHLWTTSGVGVTDNTNGGSITTTNQGVAGAWSWDTGLIYSYRQGQTKTSVSLPGAKPSSVNRGTQIGSRGTTGGGNFSGLIYNVVVYNRLLSDAEISANFTALSV